MFPELVPIFIKHIKIARNWRLQKRKQDEKLTVIIQIGYPRRKQRDEKNNNKNSKCDEFMEDELGNVNLNSADVRNTLSTVASVVQGVWP